jgi:hypothetical protein
MSDDTEYNLKGDEIKDRRNEIRKKAGKGITIGVANAQTIQAQAQTDQTDNHPDYLALRKTPRKTPAHQIKVACFSDIIDEATILDLSLQGLKIRGRISFEIGQN